MAKPKLERTFVYTVNGSNYTNKSEALSAKAQYDLEGMLVEATDGTGLHVVPEDYVAAVQTWMLNNAKTLRKLLDTYIKNSAVAAAEHNETDSEGENTDDE